MAYSDRLALSSVSPWLLPTVVSKMQKHFDTGTVTLDLIDKGDAMSPGAQAMQATIEARTAGKVVQVPADTGMMVNAGAGVPELRSYPRPGSQVPDVLQYAPKRLITSLQRTAEAVARSSGSQSMVNAVTAREFTRAMEDTRHKENLWILGDGSALLATTTGTKDWEEAIKGFNVVSASKIKVGMEITPRVKTSGALIHADWSTVAGPFVTEAKRALVTAVTATTVVCTYHDGTVISLNTASDVDVTVGLYFADSQGEVPWGLDMFCDDGNPVNHGFDPAVSIPTDATGIPKTLGGINRTTNDWFQAYNATDLAGVAINLKKDIAAMQRQLITRDSTLAGKKGKIVALSDEYQWDQISYALDEAKRTNTRTTAKEGQWDALEYGIFKFVYDVYCLSGTFFFFDPEHLHRLVLKEWGIETFEGSDAYTQQTSGLSRPTSAWQGNLDAYKQHIASSCRRMARITGAKAA